MPALHPPVAMRRSFFSLYLLAATLLAGCDVGLTEVECLTNSECGTGEICNGGACGPALDGDVPDGSDTGGGDVDAAGDLCGNGTLDEGEACDDGDDNDDRVPDGCRSDCSLPTCGDGVVDPGYDESCDDGDENSDTTPNACRTTCERPTCGDGVVDTEYDEACDSGSEGLHCSVDCRIAYDNLCEDCVGLGAPCGEEMRCRASEAAGDAPGLCAPECDDADDCPGDLDCLYSAALGLGVCTLEPGDCGICGDAEDCADGIDNDCNDAIDCEDDACSGDEACVESVCDDGEDNDDDGLTDCDDDDCDDDDACRACVAVEVSDREGAEVFGTDAGRAEPLPTSDCTSGDPPHFGFVVAFEAPSSGRWSFDAVGTTESVSLGFADDACGQAEAPCRPRADFGSFNRLGIDLAAGEIVYVVIALDTAESGERVVLNAWTDEAGSDRCNDRLDNDGDERRDCDDPACSSLERCSMCENDRDCSEADPFAICGGIGACQCTTSAVDRTWCAGTCVVTDSNPLHCGECGNVCESLSCERGECQTGRCTNDEWFRLIENRTAWSDLASCIVRTLEGGAGFTPATLSLCVQDRFDDLGRDCGQCLGGVGLCASIDCAEQCASAGSVDACEACILAACATPFVICGSPG